MSIESVKSFVPANESQRHAEENLRRVVETAGGQLLGVQMNLMPSELAQLWFKNPQTNRNTHIDFDAYDFRLDDLAPRISTALQEDTDSYMNRRVGVPVNMLRGLSDKLLKLSEEVDALYEEKKK